MISTYTIKTVRWKQRAIGIAVFRVSLQGINILINQKLKNGKLLYPYKYFCSYDLFMKGEVYMAGDVKLRMVNIDEMEVVGKRNE